MATTKKISNKNTIGFIDTLRKFVKLLEDMERGGEFERKGTGKIIGPDYSAIYGYKVKIGIDRKNFSRRYEAPKFSRQKVQIDNKKQIDIIDKGRTLSVLAHLPYIKDEEIDVNVIDKTLKITANIHNNKIEKSIPIKDIGDETVSFKNGILEIELRK